MVWFDEMINYFEDGSFIIVIGFYKDKEFFFLNMVINIINDGMIIIWFINIFKWNYVIYFLVCNECRLYDIRVILV